MLCLGQEVRGDQRRVGLVVSNEQRLRWAVQAVYSYVSKHLLFCQGDEQTAGADNLVYAGDTLGSVGQGSNGPGDQQTSHRYTGLSEAPDLPRVSRMGHAVSGRLFPADYVPVGGGSYFIGRRARLESRQAEGGSLRVLWLASTTSQ